VTLLRHLDGDSIVDVLDLELFMSYWQQWDIPLSVLSDAGVTLSTVQDITIGVGSQNGGRGGTGKLYFDDLRLYPAEG
jgi:hypothetical protein